MINNTLPDAVNILLLEDDAVDAEVVQRVLKKRNMANPLYRATCGVDALEILRGENQKQKIPKPYIMLVDINMPRMNGFEFLKEVRNDENLKKSVAFILTTSARDVDVSTAYELSAAGYFLKDNIDKLVDMFGFYREINKFSDKR